MAMKSLLIMRHGKAEAYNEDGDKYRVLAHRGKREAKTMGELILDKAGTPDLVVSSDAARAHETAVLAAEASGYNEKIVLAPMMYDASLGSLLKVVQSLPESASTALIVGHNPGLEDLATQLTKSDLPSGVLPTSGVIHLHIKGHWSKLRAGGAKLVAEYSPKNL